MNTEEHDEPRDDLWELLGQAKKPQVSPFFSRDVLRTIRETEQEKPGVIAWLRSHWQVAAASTCALTVVASFAAVQQMRQPDPVVLLAQQVSVSPDYQVISNLDELLDSEHNSAWLEASAH